MTKGTYAGGTFGFPFGLGGGLYIDSHGRIYPQLYGGTPGPSLSAGYTSDLEGLLTGTSISGSPGAGSVRFNTGTSGGASGFGIGTPGVGVTQGFGPLEMSHDFSQPWVTPHIRNSVATTGIPSRYNVWEYDYPGSPPIPENSDASSSTPNTYTPQYIADFLNKYIFSPAMGPHDELTPFARSLQSRSGRIGPNTGSSIPFLSSREQNPLGDGMSGWSASAGGGMPASTASPENGPTGIASRASADGPALSPFGTGAAPVPFLPVSQSAPGGLLGLMAEIGAIDPPKSDESRPGGLLGLIEEYMRNNDPSGR